jgi:hypothetical protein
MSIQKLDEQEQGGAHDVQPAIDGIISNSAVNGYNVPTSASTSSYGSDIEDLAVNLPRPSVSAPDHVNTTPLVTDNDAPNPKICGVCKEKEYKYKCSRCLLP